MKKVLSVLLIFLLCGCYNEYKMPKDVYIKTYNKTFEIYDNKAYIKDLIKDTNVDIMNKNKKLKTTKIGENEEVISYKYKNRTYKYNVKYNVEDKTKPIFLTFNSYFEIHINDKINFCKEINYADNYDKKPTCTVKGDYDNSKVGIYNLKYVIKDKNGNKNEKDFTINVVDDNKQEEINDNGNIDYESLNFKDVIKKYKTKNNMIGIDVSYWQGDIDFKKVKEAGCEFVIIRMAVNSDIDKNISLDSYYKKNIKDAKKYGLKVGVYIYTTAINKKMAKSHANYVIKKLDKEKLDFPIAFDFENWNDFTSYKISTFDITNSFLTFKNELKKYGYDAMLYSSLNYLNNVWMFNDTYKVWLAHYTDETSYQGKYIMWQLANNGQIDGINGFVDIDIYYKE